MAQSTELRDQTLPRAPEQTSDGILGGPWEKVKLVFVRSIFWSYERGTWQYDLIVLAILAFIFLMPRSWFSDRPTLQLTDLRHVQGVVQISQGNGWPRIYQIDARVVDSMAIEKPEDAIREILERRLKKPIAMQKPEPMRDKNNVTLGYTVVVSGDSSTARK
jgi:hypothetical protein